MGEASVRADLKVDFLMAQVGQGEKVFDSYLERVPSSQIEVLWQRVNELSSLKTFLDIAENRQARGFLLDEAVLESFLYESRPFSKENEPKTFTMGEGSELTKMTLKSPFEIEVTPVTQLQYASVTGKNPSNFVVKKKILVLQEKVLGLNGEAKIVELDPNRPVESVSWQDAQEYFRSLSEFNPFFNFDLPTEAQWEFAARGEEEEEEEEEEEVNNFLDDDVSEPDRHTWYNVKAGGQTQPVARTRANSFGLLIRRTMLRSGFVTG